MPLWSYQKWISIGWTAVWCSCLIALGNILTNEPEVYGLLLLSSTFEIPPEHLLVFYIPLFVLSGWIGGLAVCLGLFLGGRAICRLLRQIRKSLPQPHAPAPPASAPKTPRSSRSKNGQQKSGNPEIHLGPALAAAAAEAAGEAPGDGASKNSGDPSVQVDAADIQLEEIVTSDASVSKREMIRRELRRAIGKNKGMEKIYSDTRWTSLMEQAAQVGRVLDYGVLHMVYIRRVEKGQCLVIPDRKDKNTVIAMSRDTLSDRVIDSLV
ncbi:MAG: hypothetical protein ACQERN_14440 [Thermodesulfobacteriota bacterium]